MVAAADHPDTARIRTTRHVVKFGYSTVHLSTFLVQRYFHDCKTQEQKKRNTKPKINHWVRNIEICKDILEGSSFVAVAKKAGLRAGRVRQIFYSRMFRLRTFVEISPHRSEHQALYRYKKEELIQRLNSLLEED